MMTREKLCEIVYALRSMTGNLVGGEFGWTKPSLKLFARILSGCELDDVDRNMLDRACEIAEGIARILRNRNLETRFNDYRAALSKDIAIDAREFLGYVLRDSLLGEIREREQEERHLRRFRKAEERYLREVRDEVDD